jgi:hypothetical protein|nr:MAG: hypothetical protein [Caudoviricetes sp.]
MSNIRSVRLVTGEDIVCDFIVNGETALLKNPVQLMAIPSRSGGQPSFGFMPFPLMSNDKEVSVKLSHVVFTCDIAEDFLNQYNSVFGSGIVVPPKDIILN